MDELATPKQIRAIENLMVSVRRGYELRDMDLAKLSRAEAGKMIRELIEENHRWHTPGASNG